MNSGYYPTEYGYGNYSNGGFNTTPFPEFDYNRDGLITSAGIYKDLF